MRKSIYLILSTLVLIISPFAPSQSATGNPRMTIPRMLVAQQDIDPSLDLTDWQKYQTKEAEVWLPNSFVGGDLSSDDIDEIITNTETLGPEFSDIAQTMKNNKELLHFMAFDKNLGVSGLTTTMNIASEKVLSSISLDDFLDMAIKKLPAQIQILDSKRVSLDKYNASKLTARFSIKGNEVKMLQYCIKDGSTVWVITYGTGLEDFEAELPIFQKSIRTFKVAPKLSAKES